MHRAGRAGRFGQKGVCLTLYDNDEDEFMYKEIAKKQNLDILELTKPDLLKDALAEIGFLKDVPKK